MRLRKFDQNGDYRFGNGAADFWINQPEGVAQAAQQRLMLWQGQWFLDRREGTPYQLRVLGRRTEATRDPAMRARILGTQGVLKIETYASQVNRDIRGYALQATISTIYGPATLNLEPQ